MQEYFIEEKRKRVWENIIHYFSHGLSWFLNFLAQFIGTFIKALFDAVKTFIRP